MANFVCFTCTDTFSISYSLLYQLEAMPHVPRPFPPFSHLERGRLCPLLTTDYILGLQVEGESPDGASHMISVSSYKCATCADWKYHLRVFGLFLLEHVPLLSSETAPFTAHTLNCVQRPSALASRLPRACVLTAPPCVSDLSACLASLTFTSLPK